MTRKRTSAVESTPSRAVPVRVVLVTMDPHLASACSRASATLARELPGLSLSLHAAAEFASDSAALKRCCEDIGQAHIIVVTMLFMEDHFQPVLAALAARRQDSDALVCAMSASEVARLTRMGTFSMDGPRSGLLALLSKLRGNKTAAPKGSAGARQMRMLRRIPKLLRFIPGTAQDVRAYFLTLQYWLGGSEANVTNLVRFLIDRYADGPRRELRGLLTVAAPVEYPEVGLYHPRMPGRIGDRMAALPRPADPKAPTVGLLVLRSYVLAGNTAHYDGVIAALESRGLRVVPAYASGLDSQPAIERFFRRDGVTTVDALVSLTGFSLVGGPAYNDSTAAARILATLDVPYVVAHPVEFQTLEQWQASERGLTPVESTMMISIPELDGATGPLVFGGRSTGGSESSRDMRVDPERAAMLAARVAKLVSLRRTARTDRKVAIVLFNFPPGSGNTGTAAHLAVFESLHHTLRGLKSAGYKVDVPTTVDELRERIVSGNSNRHGAHANVHARVAVDDHVRRERWLRDIEAQWGPAPGRQQCDGRSIFVLGERFGNVFVGIQPAMGYEGDPMRLLFERGFAPTHAFSAFYRWLREDFRADAVLHFGTHGALEFMPGKQCGMSAACWPDRLIGDLPNIYLYAANNPSEGSIAKRRAAATLISYLTPPLTHAGLYRGLLELKASLDKWRSLPPQASTQQSELGKLIQAQAAAVNLASAAPPWMETAPATISQLTAKILELEYTLIPHGLHIVGEPLPAHSRQDMLGAIAEATHGVRPETAALAALARGASAADAARLAGADAEQTALYSELAEVNRLLAEDHELPAIITALDGRFIPPVAGGDVLRSTAILPTGRNVHGFDPFRIPSAFAIEQGAQQAQRLIERHQHDHATQPETVAIVLWGTDNLKTEGEPIAQALALIGAVPRFDSYGRLVGAVLKPLADLGRPRIDVVVSLSGIFRDLLPLQIKLLAEACRLAAAADEPPAQNFIRKHALEYQALHGGDLDTASLRVFGNAEGAYGANVNHLIENGRWRDEDELAEAYTRRKGHAFGCDGRPTPQPALLQSVLAQVDLAYQNLDSAELGVTTIDHYFDTLGGISRAVRRARGGKWSPIYIGDQTMGSGTIRTLSEQVVIETHTRMLNPKWYEGMLAHGYEGVRQIEAHITNTVGWSATTGQVEPWVYQKLAQTYVLDEQMRERLARLNPAASAKVAGRLIEAHERRYWEPDAQTLEALQRAGEDLEDRLEGVYQGAAA